MRERHKYGSSFYNLTFKKIIKRELLSFFGRLFSKKRVKTSKEFLHLGCGNSFNNENFLDCDFFDLNFFWPLNKKKIYQLDLRYPLPFDNFQFKAVFSEHTIEHLYPSECQKLFFEVHRVLKKNGIFRIIVTDLRKYVEAYISPGKKVLGDKEFNYGCELIWDVTNNYEHKSAWDSDWLIAKLQEAGFKHCKEVTYNNSEMPELILDKEARQYESLYVEAKKI